MYIQLNLRRLTWIVALLIGLGALLGLARGGAPGPARPLAGRIFAVPAAPLESASGYERVGRFVGRVELARSSELAFELDGKLARVLAEEGARVSVGDPLAELDTERLRARRAERLAARDEARAQVALETLRSDRFQRLLAEDAIAPQRADDARLGLAACRAASTTASWCWPRSAATRAPGRGTAQRSWTRWSAPAATSSPPRSPPSAASCRC